MNPGGLHNQDMRRGGGMGGVGGGARRGVQNGMPGFYGNHGNNMHSHQNMNKKNNMYQNYNSNNINNVNTTNQSKSWFGSLFNSMYEIIMVVFLIGLVVNCCFGKNYNDKYALAWYEANKQYFEERYEKIGLDKEEEDGENSIKPIQNDSKNKIPLIKENSSVYKLHCANYRYIKWLFVVLEFTAKIGCDCTFNFNIYE